MKVCWKCGAPLPDFDFGKVSFRASCDHCHADLHVCRNCTHYQPGKPNDCLIPNTDPVSDREKSNLCESFKLLGKKEAGGASKDDIEKKLFG